MGITPVDNLQWAPAPGLVAVAWVITAAAALWTAATWLTSADADGVTVGGLLKSRHHPWPLVQGVRVLRVRRLGRESSLLELDTVAADGSERLYVFGRLDLAADPEDVAPALAS